MGDTTIYFIRHGQIDNPKKIMYGGLLDLPLTEEGKQQIHHLAEWLKSTGVKIDAIYTSSLSRTRDSAGILADVLDKPPIFIETGLIDTKIPALVGHPNSEKYQIYARGTDEYSDEFVKKGNESRAQLVQRMVNVFEKIRKENIGKTVVIVGHGDPFRFLLFYLENPNKQVPFMGELRRLYYPPKGKGWKMVFDKDGKILDTEFIGEGEKK